MIRWFVLSLCAGCFTAGNVLLRLGLDRSRVVLFQGGIAGLPDDLVALAQEWRMYMSAAAYAAALLIWMRLVAVGPISVLYPAVSGLAFIMVAFADYAFLSTELNFAKFVGIAIIIAGIWVISAAG